MPPSSLSATNLEGRSVVVDCRWLAISGTGTGRVTELLLSALCHSPPPGHWALWGPRGKLEPFLFPGATVVESDVDPRALGGQRELRTMPLADVALYPNPIRPLRPGPSVTIIHDTIPVRHGAGRASRVARRAFLAAVAHASTRILTDSELSKGHIVCDLRVAPARIDVLRFPIPLERSQAISRLRGEKGQTDRLLYVGRFLAHKNLRRLCLAFHQSSFARRGGRLVLVGGWEGEVEPLRAWIEREGVEGVELRTACSDGELEELLATSRALVLPSLEEGYGLPAFEAAASGLPVAASRTGAMTELPSDRAVLFEPTDVAAMQAAIDEATERPPLPPAEETQEGFLDVVLRALARAVHRKTSSDA
jgi:glycosyltransferase involved in cell wall biosynthesis